MSDWQPIETAPRDGVRILVVRAAYGTRRVEIARWNDDKYASRPRPYFDYTGYSITESRVHPPVAWMPLPALPDNVVYPDNQPLPHPTSDPVGDSSIPEELEPFFREARE